MNEGEGEGGAFSTCHNPLKSTESVYVPPSSPRFLSFPPSSLPRNVLHPTHAIFGRATETTARGGGQGKGERGKVIVPNTSKAGTRLGH
jgi:hypothetical protein